MGAPLVWTTGNPVPSVRLNTGALMPAIAFGTGFNRRARRGRNSPVAALVNMSLSLGYTHIDTSERYPGFDSVGSLLRQLPRERMFVTSKVDPTQFRGRRHATCGSDGQGCREAMLTAANTTVHRLGIVPDLMLLHRPPRPPRRCDSTVHPPA